MPGIMADNDVLGQFEDLLKVLESKEWKGVWTDLHITVESFEGLGLVPEAPDSLVWRTCQAREILLFTGNRNREGPDSLEETIRNCNQIDSLPVVTLSNPKRFSRDRTYANEVVEALLEILMDLKNRRGAGRLYVP